MKELQVKVVAVVLIAILVALIIPVNVFAAETNIQVVKTESEDYIIYVKDLAETEFDFAISEEPDAQDIDLNYVNSVTDEDGNQVALVTKEKYENELQTNEHNYLYIKNQEEIKITEIKFDDVLDSQKAEIVATTTKRITTSEITETIQDGDVEGTYTTITIGGLKIEGNEGSTYYYTRTKLPVGQYVSQYSELMELAKTLQSENYEELDIYTKLETEKSFYDLYTSLKDEQDWVSVENMKVLQLPDTVDGDNYVIFLKEVDENGNVTIDAKFMESVRVDDAGVNKTEETKAVKETAKLPITGDSIILFVVLAIIVLVAIIVFIRMKKLQNKESK